MNIKDVQKRVAAIREKAYDPEYAHSLEEQLHQDVLRATAQGNDSASTLANECLKSLKIKFPRWMA